MPKILNKIAVIGVLLGGISVNAYAIGNGLYLGMMMGPASNTAGDQQAFYFPDGIPPVPSNGPPPTTLAKPKGTQFSTRAFMGYKFNTYAAWELGFSFFSKIGYNTPFLPANATQAASPSVRVRDIDLVGKGIWPMGPFSIFGKAGVAVTYSAVSSGFNYVVQGSPSDPANQTFSYSSSNSNKFNPTVSVGAAYDLNQSWQIDISWNRLMAGGYASNIDSYMVGLTYHFVDVYCGQFLCDD